jgi:hypothetical protein
MNLPEHYLGIQFVFCSCSVTISAFGSEIFPHLTPTIESIDEEEEEQTIFSCI